mmetsp:Transcript_51242/g.166123  ORF Transcript_51242/g.166123 Transcript_51242/m.166123 type:complete len:824 (+) Transcript_51242:648-3119(+)
MISYSDPTARRRLDLANEPQLLRDTPHLHDLSKLVRVCVHATKGGDRCMGQQPSQGLELRRFAEDPPELGRGVGHGVAEPPAPSLARHPPLQFVVQRVGHGRIEADGPGNEGATPKSKQGPQRGGERPLEGTSLRGHQQHHHASAAIRHEVHTAAGQGVEGREPGIGQEEQPQATVPPPRGFADARSCRGNGQHCAKQRIGKAQREDERPPQRVAPQDASEHLPLGFRAQRPARPILACQGVDERTALNLAGHGVPRQAAQQVQGGAVRQQAPRRGERRGELVRGGLSSQRCQEGMRSHGVPRRLMWYHARGEAPGALQLRLQPTLEVRQVHELGPDFDLSVTPATELDAAAAAAGRDDADDVAGAEEGAVRGIHEDFLGAALVAPHHEGPPQAELAHCARAAVRRGVGARGEHREVDAGDWLEGPEATPVEAQPVLGADQKLDQPYPARSIPRGEDRRRRLAPSEGAAQRGHVRGQPGRQGARRRADDGDATLAQGARGRGAGECHAERSTEGQRNVQLAPGAGGPKDGGLLQHPISRAQALGHTGVVPHLVQRHRVRGRHALGGAGAAAREHQAEKVAAALLCRPSTLRRRGVSKQAREQHDRGQRSLRRKSRQGAACAGGPLEIRGCELLPDDYQARRRQLHRRCIAGPPLLLPAHRSRRSRAAAAARRGASPLGLQGPEPDEGPAAAQHRERRQEPVAGAGQTHGDRPIDLRSAVLQQRGAQPAGRRPRALRQRAPSQRRPPRPEELLDGDALRSCGGEGVEDADDGRPRRFRNASHCGPLPLQRWLLRPWGGLGQLSAPEPSPRHLAAFRRAGQSGAT